jgi:adenosylhomocysteinase
MKDIQAFIQAVLINASAKLQRLVIVTHLTPGSDIFLNALHSTIPIAALIPKPNSIDPLVRAGLDGRIPVLAYNRQQIKDDTKQFLALLKASIGENSFAIIDTGGYFSDILSDTRHYFGRKLLGVIEDTENGHQKYEAAFAKHQKLFPCPVVSVARSDLKRPEDYLVGQAIVFSAEAQLREQGTILTGKYAAVLGYGKIGQSISQNLQCKSVHVEVIEIDPIRQILAQSHGFHTGSAHTVLPKADLLFCATGNLSLTAKNMPHLKPNAFVFCATSGDDEIEGHRMLLNRQFEHCSRGNTTKVELKNNTFFLCNDGNAVNFLNGGVVGNFIKLVQAEFVFAAGELPKYSACDRIHKIENHSKDFIARLWLKHFSS